MAERKARVVAEKRKDGKTEITVVDPHSGKVISQHATTCGESDIRRISDQLKRSGNQTEVIDRR